MAITSIVKRKTKTLKQYIETIECELEYLDIKPYSHNIVSLTLRCIAVKYGKPRANQVVKDMGLKDYGFHTEPLKKEDWDKLTGKD